MASYLAGGGQLQGVQSASDHVSQSTNSLLPLPSRTHYRNQKGARLLFRRLGLTFQELQSHLDQVDERRSQLVEELDASRNHISAIPRALIKFTNLTSLILSNNNLTTIPYEIYSNTTQLELLVLSENEISVIPEDMPHFLSKLITLKLDDNRIEILPYTIYHFEKLENLQLGSEYGGNLIESLPDTMSSLTALKEINASYNRIHELPDNLFEENVSLEHINLSHNQIVQLPVTFLRRLNYLKSLDVSYNQISTIPSAIIDDIMRLTMRELEFIDISNNRLFVLPAVLLDQKRTQLVARSNPFNQSLANNNNNNNTIDNSNDESYSRLVRSMTRTVILVSEYASSSAVTQDTAAAHQPAFQEDASAIDRVLSAMANDLNVFVQTPQGNLSGTVADTVEEVEVEDDDADADEEEISTATHILESDTVDILENSESSPAPLFLSLREIAYRLLLSNNTDLSSTSSEYIPEHIAFDIKNSLAQTCPVCSRHYVHEWVSTVQIKGQGSVRKVRFCSMTCWKEYKSRLETRLRYYEENRVAERRQEMVDSIRQNPLQENSIDWIVAAVTAANEQEEELDLIANL